MTDQNQLIELVKKLVDNGCESTSQWGDIYCFYCNGDYGEGEHEGDCPYIAAVNMLVSLGVELAATEAKIKNSLTLKLTKAAAERFAYEWKRGAQMVGYSGDLWRLDSPPVYSFDDGSITMKLSLKNDFIGDFVQIYDNEVAEAK